MRQNNNGRPTYKTLDNWGTDLETRRLRVDDTRIGETIPTTMIPEIPEDLLPVIPGTLLTEIPLSIQGYTHNITFTATAYDIVTWTAGTITFYNGDTQSIIAGHKDLTSSSPYYIYFNLDSSPTVLKTTTNYASVVTVKVGLLCVAQIGSTSSIKASVFPSYGKQPLITADIIDMTGLVTKTFDDGGTLQSIQSTQITAGYLKLTSGTFKDETWYNESGVVIDADYGIALYGGQIAFRTFATQTDYLAGTPIQCYVDTNGCIAAGGGNVLLNSTGIKITANDVLTMYSGATKIGYLKCESDGIGFVNANSKGIGFTTVTGGDIVLTSADDIGIDAADAVDIDGATQVTLSCNGTVHASVTPTYGLAIQDGQVFHLSHHAGGSPGAMWIDPSVAKRLHFRDKDGTDCYIDGT